MKEMKTFSLLIAWKKCKEGVTENMKDAQYDAHYRIDDTEALHVAFRLLAEEGLNVGGSSGINVAGAMALARDLGPGSRVVTILCDYGTRYQSKLFNPAFLKEKGLPCPDWLGRGPAALPGVFEEV